MPNPVTPTITPTADGGVILLFPFNHGLIEELKAEIPSAFRSYDPATKAWTVRAWYAETATDLFYLYFPKPTQQQTLWTDPREEAMKTLYLRSDAPWEVVAAAYRALAKLYHPDKSGNADERTMLDINRAYEIVRTLYGK